MLEITHAKVPLNDIQEPKRNPNYMSPEDFESLRRVIREKGALQPPLLRRIQPASPGAANWEIVDGVHRIRAMFIEGQTEVFAVLTDEDEAGAKTLQVAMNKIRGELNLTSVAETVRELVELGVPDTTLMLLGYAEDDLRTMMEMTKTTSEEDVLEESTGSFLDEDPAEDTPPPKPYLLELTFKTAAELRRVKRVLKKAGSGDHAAGLLALIEGA